MADLEQQLYNILTIEIAREFILEDHGTVDEGLLNAAVALAANVDGGAADIAIVYNLLKEDNELL